MTMPISIEVKNLYASWTESSEENMTLENINFSVNGDAPFLAVVGHVGSGKVGHNTLALTVMHI